MISKEAMLVLYGYDDYWFMAADCQENGEWFPSLIEVAHKCKEDAEEKGCCIKSYLDRCHSPLRQVGVAYIGNKLFRGYNEIDESESEAIFKAYQYVLDSTRSTNEPTTN